MKKLKMKLMKKLSLSVGIVVLCFSCILAVLNNRSQDQSDLFQQNIDALSDEEITVGKLCMECPNAACVSLGVVILEHFPA
ncbi:MAG: hypothetical protein PUH82_00450 [Bacteroidales bacterium]|uniref:hypothetical protein n=1 Tax=Candidatus Cryptobacteroides sp. TaxID=2952915 RepID=UPI002A75C7B5|nr:hypothetical protein [Candidatus Cryptobacteroides sp.]MDD7134828.1 hypothetical protein [Bacteroidales bacterium]MDY2701935.1 hypothetical protein [Candidatus Cryptobacteroides sp.]